MSKLLKLNQQVRSCRLCRLCRTRMNGVPGEGNEDAAVMFIGEGPGFNEDREGRPFVGAAGQFLEELLAVAGFSREDVYITNVVKCRPPQNRDPLPDEIDACAPYLERQMTLIDPLVVVTLGRYSMFRFFPNDRITAVAGQARYAEGRMVVTMLHPAYALRNVEAKEQMRDAFRKLPAIVAQARAERSNRPAPAPAASSAQDDAAFAAILDQHLDEIDQRLRDTAPPEPAAPAPTAPADPFAYTAAVKGVRKARKVASATPAVESGIAQADEQPVISLSDEQPMIAVAQEDQPAGEIAPIEAQSAAETMPVMEQPASDVAPVTTQPIAETAPVVEQTRAEAASWQEQPAAGLAVITQLPPGDEVTVVPIAATTETQHRAPQARRSRKPAASAAPLANADELNQSESLPTAATAAAVVETSETYVVTPETAVAGATNGALSVVANEAAQTEPEPETQAPAKGRKKGKQEPAAVQLSLF